MSMNQYKNKPEGFIAIRRKTLIVLVPILFIIGASSIVGMAVNDKDALQNMEILLCIGLFFIIILTTIAVRAVKSQKEAYNSYTLTIDDEK